jgi:FixJ family two-component response regulator
VADVVIVCEESRARAALEGAVRAHGQSAHACATAELALRHACVDPPRALVVDIDVDAEGGIVLARRLLAMRAQFVPVVYVATVVPLRTAMRAMRAGAVDLLLRPFDDAELWRAIEEAQARRAAWRAHRLRAERVAACHARLTVREKQVFRMLVEGKRSREIARALSATESTIRVHRSRLMRKLEVRSPAELLDSAGALADNPAVIW